MYSYWNVELDVVHLEKDLSEQCCLKCLARTNKDELLFDLQSFLRVWAPLCFTGWHRELFGFIWLLKLPRVLSFDKLIWNLIHNHRCASGIVLETAFLWDWVSSTERFLHFIHEFISDNVALDLSTHCELNSHKQDFVDVSLNWWVYVSMNVYCRIIEPVLGLTPSSTLVPYCSCSTSTTSLHFSDIFPLFLWFYWSMGRSAALFHVFCLLL